MRRQMEEKQSKPAECHLCKHKWQYKGESKYWISCPRCLSKTRSPYYGEKEE